MDFGLLRFTPDLYFKIKTDGTPAGGEVIASFKDVFPVTDKAVISFDSDSVKSIPLVVNIKPKQSGSGEPSPTNKRPISGWDVINIYVSPTTSAEDGSTNTINLPQTVYGGVLDVVSGKLTVTHKYWMENGSGDWQYASSGGTRFYIGGVSTDAKNVSTNGWSNYGKLTDSFINNGIVVGSNGRINLCGSVASAFADVNALKTALASTPLQVVYELATPTEIQLTPTEVKTLIGQNNIWSDAGTVNSIINDYVKYKVIEGGDENVQRFYKLWDTMLLRPDGRNNDGNESSIGDKIRDISDGATNVTKKKARTK